MAASVPQLSKIGKISPWALILKEKLIQVLYKWKFIKKGFLGESFRNCTSLVPELQKLADLVPGGMFWKKKLTLVLGKSQVITNKSLEWKFERIANWSLKFHKWQKIPLEIQLWKIFNQGPWVIGTWQESSLWIFWEITLSILGFLAFGKYCPCENTNQMDPVIKCNPKTTNNYPKPTPPRPNPINQTPTLFFNK